MAWIAAGIRDRDPPGVLRQAPCNSGVTRTREASTLIVRVLFCR
jgi:hypothetical protein